MNLEHIGIAVKDLEKSKNLFAMLLNTECYKEEDVKEQGVRTSFFQTGESKIELLSSISENSVIERFIAKKGEGFHHLAFQVENLEEEIERLISAGFSFVSDKPSLGADNKRIIFLHPKNTNGVLIELCEEIKAV